jgi:hypothetical protein
MRIEHRVYKGVVVHTDQCREAVVADGCRHGGKYRQCKYRPKVKEKVNGERMGFCTEHSLAHKTQMMEARLAKKAADAAMQEARDARNRLKHRCYFFVQKMTRKQANENKILSLWWDVQDAE